MLPLTQLVRLGCHQFANDTGVCVNGRPARYHPRKSSQLFGSYGEIDKVELPETEPNEDRGPVVRLGWSWPWISASHS